MKRATSAILLIAAIGGLVVSVGLPWVQRARDDARLDAQLLAVTPVPANAVEQPCSEIAARHPWVLLAIGQSNAGNHGTPVETPASLVDLVIDGHCLRSADPLPGSTGSGGSIWARLPDELRRAGLSRPVVLSVMGIDSTSIRDWSRPDSPLRRRLVERIQAMQRAGLPPDVMLWQQGEADARDGTSDEAYAAALGELFTSLRAVAGPHPMLLARSTICRTTSSAPIRRGLSIAMAREPLLRPGADTDTLDAPSDRRDGCHFSQQGLARAAELWATALLANAAPAAR